MQSLLPRSSRFASSHCDVHDLEQLSAVLRSDVTSCRCARVLGTPRASALDLLAQTQRFERLVVVSNETLFSAIRLLTFSIGESEALSWLERDMTILAKHFLMTSGSTRCKVRLEVVTRDACTRFHHDYNQLRLLCTYSGPGTIWVAREHVNVDALFESRGDVEAANQRIVPEPSNTRHAGAGDVLLLKGAKFYEPEGVGAVHRSPPAGTLGIPRLLLTIDVA